MHSPVYLAICVASLGSMLTFGAPETSSMVIGAAFAIAVLGVPHGGLDHWTGRRLLQHRFKALWWAVFFPVYLLVGISFALGWFAFPTATVIIFFLISAWHFGREDQQAIGIIGTGSSSPRAIGHMTATAMGGVVIWLPALMRPDEMRVLLRMIVPANSAESATEIVAITQMIAACAVPMAAWMMIRRIGRSPRESDAWVPVATAAIAIYTPILFSFTVFFCGWHSWLGLQRLRRNESLAIAPFVRSVAPLSVGAVIGVAVAGWWMQGGQIAPFDAQSSASLQAVFIGLSAIAVPHLLLHEIDSSHARSRTLTPVCS